MCGITGAVWLDPQQAISTETLTKMTDSLAHRGPDQSTQWRCDHHRDSRGRNIGIALGFRRLSIIDLDGAKQPLCNEKRYASHLQW